MNWSEFYQSLDAGDIAPVYLFTGPEEYVKQEAMAKLREKLLPPGLEALNDTVMEGVTAQQITDAAETMPMMCERRIVTVRDWAPLLPGKSKSDASEASDIEKRDAGWMERWLDNPAPGCVLIFYMRQSADGKKKLTGILRKKAAVVDFDLLSEADLAKWCGQKLRAQKKKIGTRALSTLTFMAGRELTRLSGELEKLSAYLGDRTEIVEDDVKAIVSASLEYNVFELMNHLLAGDMLKAQQTVRSLMQNGQNAFSIMAMLTRQLRQMAHIKCALDAGIPAQTVQEQLNMHPYAARQTAKQVSRLSAQWLTGLYEAAVESDFAVKSGRMRDQDALNAMLFKIGLADNRR